MTKCILHRTLALLIAPIFLSLSATAAEQKIGKCRYTITAIFVSDDLIQKIDKRSAQGPIYNDSYYFDDKMTLDECVGTVREDGCDKMLAVSYFLGRDDRGWAYFDGIGWPKTIEITLKAGLFGGDSEKRSISCSSP